MVSDCNVSKRPLKVLVACEYSGIVRDAFIERGHDAVSCDLLPTERPGPHYQGNVLDILNDGWDMMIGHPECKYLCWSGERWLKDNPERQEKRREAFEFFKTLYNAPIPKICIENSLSLFLERNWQKPTQTVHPFHFGDPFRKSTCLWLKGLKPLIPTDIVWQREPAVHNTWPGKDRSKDRAKTYPGIARAMAEQWPYSSTLTKIKSRC